MQCLAPVPETHTHAFIHILVDVYTSRCRNMRRLLRNCGARALQVASTHAGANLKLPLPGTVLAVNRSPEKRDVGVPRQGIYVYLYVHT